MGLRRVGYNWLHARARAYTGTHTHTHTHTQGLYNLLVCISLMCGQRIMWADWEVEGGPVVPEELPNHSVTQMESLTIDTAIVMCKEFNWQKYIFNLLFHHFLPGKYHILASYHLNKKLFIFHCRIISLQYYVGFWHTLTWISHWYTYVLSL